MLKETRTSVVVGVSSPASNITSIEPLCKRQKDGSGSDNVICTSETLVPEGKVELSTSNLSEATRSQGVVVRPENAPVRISDSGADESCGVVPEQNKTVERLSHFTPDEIAYFKAVGVRLQKAGAEMQVASYQAGEYAGEMFKAGYYVALRAWDLLHIPEVAAYRERRMAKAMKELGF